MMKTHYHKAEQFEFDFAETKMSSKCADWTKCPHAKCVRETMDLERWQCSVCGEVWTIDYDEIR